jgi:hypothetical protein
MLSRDAAPEQEDDDDDEADIERLFPIVAHPRAQMRASVAQNLKINAVTMQNLPR